MSNANINTIKGILEFAISKNCSEVHLCEDSLPILISNGKSKYLNGVSIVTKELINKIKDAYLNDRKHLIIAISNKKYILRNINNRLSFRYLSAPKTNLITDTSYQSFCYNNNGIILLNNNDRYMQHSLSYSVASFLVKNRKTSLAIVEKNKYFTLPENDVNIINIYKPELRIEQMLEILESFSIEVILVPNCSSNNIQALKYINELSKSKLIIIGSDAESLGTLDSQNILYSHNCHKEKSPSNSPIIHINTIIGNLTGEK